MTFGYKLSPLKPHSEVYIYYIKSGEVRILGDSLNSSKIITLTKLTQGQWIGWSNLLFGKACEWSAASKPTELLAIPIEIAAEYLWKDNLLFKAVQKLDHPSIANSAVQA